MHYANELAVRGNKVYFINPPSQGDGTGDLAVINRDNTIENITIIDIKPVKGVLFFRHKLPIVFNAISRRYSKKINALIPGKIDEVWCFNPHLFASLKHFNASKNFLMIYDLYKGNYIMKIARTADALISVSQFILDHFVDTSIPKLLVQHGLSNDFASISESKLSKGNFGSVAGDRIRVGYVGNLLREGMDTDVAMKIIAQHPENEFNFWGPHSTVDNNVAGRDMVISEKMAGFISFLHAQPNVFLRGTKKPGELAKEINGMDCFLFLYSAEKDSNKASNSHKIMEYLSTGKAVISTYVSNYHDTDLLVMCEPGDNGQLPELFSEVTENLALYNSQEKQYQRISFALDNTYARQIERIQSFV